MSDQNTTVSQCRKCRYWERGMCHHGLAADQERGRGARCIFFRHDASAFAFFVKAWR